MRLKPSSILFIALFSGLFLATLSVQAQEEKSQLEIESLTKDTRDPEPEAEVKPSVKSAQRDSVTQIKPALKTIPKSGEKQPKPEDPLSFNFLYYIIEKFKLSDMIE